MKNYYIAKFRVIVDGQDHSFQTVSGLGYDPNIAKEKAKERVRKDNLGKQVTAVLMEKTDMDIEEYKSKFQTGSLPMFSINFSTIHRNCNIWHKRQYNTFPQCLAKTCPFYNSSVCIIKSTG